MNAHDRPHHDDEPFTPEMRAHAEAREAETRAQHAVTDLVTARANVAFGEQFRKAMRAPPPKGKTRGEVAFEQRMSAVVESHGGRRRDVPLPWPEYDVETTRGAMRVRVFERWVACRFDDVTRMQDLRVLGGNVYSGKFNFTPLDDAPKAPDALAAWLDATAAKFAAHLRLAGAARDRA